MIRLPHVGFSLDAHAGLCTGDHVSALRDMRAAPVNKVILMQKSKIEQPENISRKFIFGLLCCRIALQCLYGGL